MVRFNDKQEPFVMAISMKMYPRLNSVYQNKCLLILA